MSKNDYKLTYDYSTNIPPLIAKNVEWIEIDLTPKVSNFFIDISKFPQLKSLKLETFVDHLKIY